MNGLTAEDLAEIRERVERSRRHTEAGFPRTIAERDSDVLLAEVGRLEGEVGRLEGEVGRLETEIQYSAD